MKNILLIGKMNEILRELNQFLSKNFRVQLSTDDVSVLSGVIKVAEPDLILVSLVGMYERHEAIFLKLQNEFSGISVLTVGIQEERDRFMRFYEGEQFENILRPVEHTVILEAVCRRLGLSKDDLSREESGEGKASGKKRILVVDDNGPTQRIIKGMLEETYEVQIVPSGVKAMTSIGKQRPDLILLDYEMPVCDGRQTLEMIRADEELDDIPVIFLTGVNDREHIESVLALRPQGYLLKPPVQEKLLETIRKVIR